VSASSFSISDIDVDRLFFSNDKYEEQRRQWGGGIRGNKSTQMMRKRAKAAGQVAPASSFNKL